ncbi:TonB-dependent receptor [Spongiibacter nanhainus]|uniref:TonB-dependent receptor n=1 Tax=Spongiibacter nanhainus TaxID=2794344 RepID=A0A7T4R2Z3_9GAMM|nr:TonB-dependent receptor [Spongiibacter nanhainus]QQD19498.1 TonB-dependent receptor [Spongiibacter nanhainus]
MSNSRGVVEEVIVTARRRNESLSEVPLSVQALGAEALEQKQVTSDADLQVAVPGLTIRQTQGNNSLTYSIRGQSADTFSGSPSAVVSYLNEVPLTIQGASTFYDLESIQVLKGPQGTLFGRNTTGGAVLFSTAKPSAETEASLKLKAGNYDLLEVEGMVNLPISDQLRVRLAANSISKDGYIENVNTGEDHGDIGRDSARLTVSFMPNDQLDNTLVYGYSRSDGTNTGATYVYSIYTAEDEAKYNRDLNTSSEFIAGSVEEQRKLGYYKTQHPFGADHIGEDEVLVNTTTFALNEDVQIKNILGYTAGDTDSEQPALGAEYPTFATRNLATGKVGNEVKVESYSNELQLSGTAMDGNLDYITGIYLQQQRTDTLWPQTYFDGAVNATNNFRIETDTTAFYAQGSYRFSPVLRATAGLRFTEEDVSIEQLAQSDYRGVDGFAQKQDETFREPSWLLGLEYSISDSLFAYANARGSFRSGGFNGSAPPVNAGATGGGNKFEQETVEDIELGLKYEGNIGAMPARMNVAIYNMWIEDVQRIEFPDPPGDVASIAVTANIPEMEVRGIEFDASISPLANLDLGIAATYTDAEFTDGETELFGTEYQYGPVANTPENTLSVYAHSTVYRDGQGGEVALRAEVYNQSSMYFSNASDSLTPDTELPSYTLVNLRASWDQVLGSQFSAALFGKNVTDEEYFVGGMPLGASLGHNAAVVGEPATYGVELSYRF